MYVYRPQAHRLDAIAGVVTRYKEEMEAILHRFVALLRAPGLAADGDRGVASPRPAV